MYLYVYIVIYRGHAFHIKYISSKTVLRWVTVYYRTFNPRFCAGGPINLHETMKYKNKPQLLGIERTY